MEMTPKRRLELVSGRTHPGLAEEIASCLGVTLSETNIRRFADGEIHCRFDASMRRRGHVHRPDPLRPGERLHHRAADHGRRCQARIRAHRITAVCPYYGYSRQDRKATGREPITAKLVADLLSAAGVDRVVSVDLHSGQIQGFFDVPVDHLTAAPVLLDYLREHGARDLVVIAPDAGRVKVAERYSQLLDTDLALVHKRRPRGTYNQVEAMDVVGNVKGRPCVIIDDMIDTAGTVAAPPTGSSRRARPTSGRWRPTPCCRTRRSTGSTLPLQPGDRHATRSRCRSTAGSRSSRCSRSRRSSRTRSTPCSRTPRSRRSSVARTFSELISPTLAAGRVAGQSPAEAEQCSHDRLQSDLLQRLRSVGTVASVAAPARPSFCRSVTWPRSPSTSSRVARWAPSERTSPHRGEDPRRRLRPRHGLRYRSRSGARDLRAALTTEAGLNALLSLKIGETTHLAIAKELQRHPVRQTVIHVDFQVVRRDEIVTAEVRIALVGDSEAVHRVDGTIDQEMLSLQIKAKPGDVPAVIEVDVSALEVGDSLRVSDLVLPEGVTTDVDPEAAVAIAHMPRALEPEAERPRPSQPKQPPEANRQPLPTRAESGASCSEVSAPFVPARWAGPTARADRRPARGRAGQSGSRVRGDSPQRRCRGRAPGRATPLGEAACRAGIGRRDGHRPDRWGGPSLWRSPRPT